jgi:exopolyphosphatase/guanosine-5'-triphosphate,3'-diphosphate pyrophosphatase
MERELIANLCRYHRKAMPSQTHGNFQTLGPEDKRIVSLLIPLLRLADSLDRSHEQRIETMQCELRNGQVNLRLRSSQDIDLEQWAADRAAEAFRQVYGRQVNVTKARA